MDFAATQSWLSNIGSIASIFSLVMALRTGGKANVALVLLAALCLMFSSLLWFGYIPLSKPDKSHVRRLIREAEQADKMDQETVVRLLRDAESDIVSYTRYLVSVNIVPFQVHRYGNDQELLDAIERSLEQSGDDEHLQRLALLEERVIPKLNELATP